jgi:hypothetical protein
MKAIKKKQNAPAIDPLSWDKPYSDDKDIRPLERSFTEASSQIAFTPNTIMSIDDDQYRLISALVENMGFVRVNNPKKAFGPVSTNYVSIATSIVLGVNLLGRSQNYNDVIKILLMWMTGKSQQSDVEGENMTCLDHGYTSELLLKYLLSCGFGITGIDNAAIEMTYIDMHTIICMGVGTHKRVKCFPFTFGSIDASQEHQYISERGAKSLYVVKKQFGSYALYAHAYQSGNGRVATLITTLPQLAIWIYKTKNNNSWRKPQIGHELIQQTIDHNTRVVTQAQGGLDWHICCVGFITSTIAQSIIDFCAKKQLFLPEEANFAGGLDLSLELLMLKH